MSVAISKKSKERELLDERLVKCGYNPQDFSNLARNALKKKVHELEVKVADNKEAKVAPPNDNKEATNDNKKSISSDNKELKKLEKENKKLKDVIEKLKSDLAERSILLLALWF